MTMLQVKEIKERRYVSTEKTVIFLEPDSNKVEFIVMPLEPDSNKVEFIVMLLEPYSNKVEFIVLPGAHNTKQRRLLMSTFSCKLKQESWLIDGSY